MNMANEMPVFAVVGPWVVPLIEAAATAVTTWWATRRQEKNANRVNSTSYQRMVKDLNMAGLNPMLAYQQGHGEANLGTNPQPVKFDFSAKYAEQKLLQAQLETQESIQAYNRAAANAASAGAVKSLADADFTKFSTEKERDVWRYNRENVFLRLDYELDKLKAEWKTSHNQAERSGIEKEMSEIQKRLLLLSIPGAEFEAKRYEFLKDFKSETWKDYIKYLVPWTLQQAGSAARAAVPFMR